MLNGMDLRPPAKTSMRRHCWLPDLEWGRVLKILIAILLGTNLTGSIEVCWASWQGECWDDFWCWMVLLVSSQFVQPEQRQPEQWQQQVTVAMLERNLLRLHQNFNDKVGCTDWLSRIQHRIFVDLLTTVSLPQTKYWLAKEVEWDRHLHISAVRVSIFAEIRCPGKRGQGWWFLPGVELLMFPRNAKRQEQELTCKFMKFYPGFRPKRPLESHVLIHFLRMDIF